MRRINNKKCVLLLSLLLGKFCTAQVNLPKSTGYFGIVHPIVSVSGNDTHFNFDGTYTVGFPTGINVFKTNTYGYSLEVVPFIQTTNGVSRLSNTLFHPGVFSSTNMALH